MLCLEICGNLKQCQKDFSLNKKVLKSHLQSGICQLIPRRRLRLNNFHPVVQEIHPSPSVPRQIDIGVHILQNIFSNLQLEY